MAVVLRLGPFVAQTALMAVQHDVVLLDAAGDVGLGREIDGLRDVAHGTDGNAGVELLAYAEDRALAHAVDNQVGTRVVQDARTQTVLPIVVMRQSAQRGFNAAQHHRHTGKQLLQDAAIYDSGVLRTVVVAPVGTIGILGTQTPRGGVFVDHRVHAPG